MNQKIEKEPVMLPAETKKKYETPEIQGMEFNSQPCLLATSGFGATRNDYGEADEYDW